MKVQSDNMNRTIIWAAVALIVGVSLGILVGRRMSNKPQSIPVASEDAPRLAFGTNRVARAQERRQVEMEMRALELRLRQLQKRHEHLARQRDELEQANVALGEAGLKSEQARVTAEQNTEFYGKVAANLIAADKLAMPKTMAEAAVRAGQLGRKLAEFKESYLGKPPAEGTPEYAAYKERMDALAAEFAPVLKTLGGDDGSGVMRQMATPQGVSEFQSLMVYGALGLNDQQFQQVHSALSRYYAEGFAQKLDLKSRPETGVEAWVDRRNALNARAVTEVQRYLTPEQRADFDKLIGKQLLWQINIGGGM